MTNLISDTELQAREMLKRHSTDFTGLIVVKYVYQLMWSSALSPARIHQIAEAVYGHSIPENDVRRGLRVLLAAGILRRRRIDGVWHYEINF